MFKRIPVVLSSVLKFSKNKIENFENYEIKNDGFL